MDQDKFFKSQNVGMPSLLNVRITVKLSGKYEDLHL